MATHIRNYLPLPWQKQKKYKENSVILVTGAASGIGMNVSLVYAKRGTRLILADLTQAALDPVLLRCRELGSEVIAVPTDVTDQKQVAALVARGVQEFGGLDIMVLCAGIAAHHVFENTNNLALFRKLMEVNFFGYLHCVKEAYPHLVASEGSLVAITSFSAEVGLPYRTAYCASKFAVTGFLEALRSEMTMFRRQPGKKCFDITIVCPPTVETNLRSNALTPDPTLREKRSASAISVEDCAVAIVDAADRRLRKAFFPWKSFLASYLRPLVPDMIDGAIRKRSAL